LLTPWNGVVIIGWLFAIQAGRKETVENTAWKRKLRNFSDEVFRNYQVVCTRWTISSLERQRNTEIRDLGHRIFRMIKKEKIRIPEVDTLIGTIDELETKIEELEDKLRGIIMQGDQTETGKESEHAGEPVPEATPTATDAPPPVIVQETVEPVAELSPAVEPEAKPDPPAEELTKAGKKKGRKDTLE
jgi:hypothetical protein